MNRSVCENEIFLVLLELELPLIDLHIKEEELLVGCSHAQLILRDCLAGRVRRLEDCIVDAERMHLLIKCLNGLHFGSRELNDLNAIGCEHCDHVGARQILYDVDLG